MISVRSNCFRTRSARGLSAEEETALHAHLEHCEACCAQMEQLAGGEAWRQEAAALLSADELDAAVPNRPIGRRWISVSSTLIRATM